MGFWILGYDIQSLRGSGAPQQKQNAAGKINNKDLSGGLVSSLGSISLWATRKIIIHVRDRRSTKLIAIIIAADIIYICMHLTIARTASRRAAESKDNGCKII
jgi:hypothetical protein